MIGGAGSVAHPEPRVEAGESVQTRSVEQLVPSPLQPRKNFSEEQLAELADSIRTRGIIQPLIVREVGGKLELIAGERRWRAAQRAGLSEVPVIIRKASDQEVLEMALVENLQRADLNPMEEAEGYQLLATSYRLTQEDIAKQVGKSRAAVANALRLLQLPRDVQDYLRHGKLSVGHAKVILGLARREDQEMLARRVIEKRLTVRQTEAAVRQMGVVTGAKKKTASKSSGADWRDLELRMQKILGTKVRMVGSAERGRLEIDYYTGSDLDRILEHLGVKFD